MENSKNDEMEKSDKDDENNFYRILITIILFFGIILMALAIAPKGLETRDLLAITVSSFSITGAFLKALKYFR
jgi:hypothetical protein